MVIAFQQFSQCNLIVEFILTIQLLKAIQPQFTPEFLLGRQICEILKQRSDCYLLEGYT